MYFSVCYFQNQAYIEWFLYIAYPNFKAPIRSLREDVRNDKSHEPLFARAPFTLVPSKLFFFRKGFLKTYVCNNDNDVISTSGSCKFICDSYFILKGYMCSDNLSILSRMAYVGDKIFKIKFHQKVNSLNRDYKLN